MQVWVVLYAILLALTIAFGKRSIGNSRPTSRRGSAGIRLKIYRTIYKKLSPQEIDKICTNVMNQNKYRKEIHVRKQALIAWRQAVEVLLTACPADLLSGERRQLFIVDILQLLLHKVLVVRRCFVLRAMFVSWCFKVLKFYWIYYWIQVYLIIIILKCSLVSVSRIMFIFTILFSNVIQESQIATVIIQMIWTFCNLNNLWTFIH